MALIALAIENQEAEDQRNTIACLAKLKHATRKMGIDIDAQIEAASEFCSDRTRQVFREFVRRDVRGLETFGFEERDGRFIWQRTKDQ